MIKMIWIFIVLLLSVWLGSQLQQHPGYVLIAFHHWTIETTLWVATIVLAIVFVMVYLLLSLISWLSSRPSSFSRWRAKRRALAAQKKTRQGLIEFSEGHWSRAKNYLIKALPDADTPLLNYLTAARAAQEMGDNQLRDQFLRDAQHCMPEARIAVELTQAQLQLANHQWEQALATLRHLQDIAPNHPYVLKLLVDLYQEVKDWSLLIALLPDLKRNKVIVGEAYTQLQHHAYLQGLIDLVKQSPPDVVAQFFKQLPKHLEQDPQFVSVYSRYLIEHHLYAEAESKLRQSLKSGGLSEQLLDPYGDIPAENARLDFIESLLKKNTHSATLLLCLGRLAGKNQLWGKAKMYFEASLQLAEKPIVYAELGHLLEQLNDQPNAFLMYRKGLDLATNVS